MDTNLAVGLTGEKREPVSNDNTAIKHGSGTQERFIIAAAKFLQKAEAKRGN